MSYYYIDTISSTYLQLITEIIPRISCPKIRTTNPRFNPIIYENLDKYKKKILKTPKT